jgi:hypothetical protein
LRKKDTLLPTLRENSSLPCDRWHGKDAFMPGKGFAVRGRRTVTSARQKLRRQREHCRAHGQIARQRPLPCVRYVAMRQMLCHACATLPCGNSLPCGIFFVVRRDTGARQTLPCLLPLPCGHTSARTAKPPPGTPSSLAPLPCVCIWP